MESPKQEADFVIKTKGSDGKYQIVGRAWKKNGQYGSFVSLSIGPRESRQSYIMVKPPEKRPADAVRTTPPKEMPVKIFPDDPIDDL